MESSQSQVYTVYLYDLPKVEYSSHRLASALKEQAGIVLNDVPIIHRDIKKQFFQGFMKISCFKFEDYIEMCEKIRYFEICGKECRSLRFEKEISHGAEKTSTDCQVFVKNIPKEMKQRELHKIFEKYGVIVSLKLCFHADHSSKGFGYVTFQQSSSASAAITVGAQIKPDQVVAMIYSDFQKNPEESKENESKIAKDENQGNNLYIKFIPDQWTEKTLRSKFEQFGHIKSMMMKRNKYGQYAFICYEDPNEQDKQQGFKSASDAQKAMDNLKIGKKVDVQTGEEQEILLYVQFQLSKQKRDTEKNLNKFEKEKQHQRTTLFIRNYPENFTKESFEQLLSPFGTIRNIILKNGYTLVGFENMLQAAQARERFNNETINGQTLQVKFYESKLMKQQKVEEFLDKKSFTQYKQQEEFAQVLDFNQAHNQQQQQIQNHNQSIIPQMMNQNPQMIKYLAEQIIQTRDQMPKPNRQYQQGNAHYRQNYKQNNFQRNQNNRQNNQFYQNQNGGMQQQPMPLPHHLATQQQQYPNMPMPQYPQQNAQQNGPNQQQQIMQQQDQINQMALQQQMMMMQMQDIKQDKSSDQQA